MVVSEYQENVDTLKEEAECSSERTSQTSARKICTGYCLTKQTRPEGRSRERKRLLSVLQISNFDLAVLRTTGMNLSDSEDMLNRGAEKFFRASISERSVIKV